MTRFKRIGETKYEDGSMIEEFELELRPGHTVKRIDTITTLGAGHKGRLARRDVFRQLECSCGSTGRSYSGSIGEDMENLQHFESPEERDRVLREEAELIAAIQESLGQ